MAQAKFEDGPASLLQRQEEEEPGEKEQEEDSETVQTKRADESIQRQEDEEKENAEEDELQPEEEETVQPEISGGKSGSVSLSVETGIQSLRGGGQPLSASSRAFFEPRFGADFSAVRVHDDSKANRLAHTINAKAFTIGKDIVFGSGKYAPETILGKRLIGHELTHVVQQRGGSLLRAKPRASWEAIQASNSLKPDVEIKAGSAAPRAAGNQGQKSTKNVIQRLINPQKVDSRKCKKCLPRKGCRPVSRKSVISLLKKAEKRAIRQARIAQQFFRCERISSKNDRFSNAARQFLKDTGKRFQISYYLLPPRRKKELERYENQYADIAKLFKNTVIHYRCVTNPKCNTAQAISKVGKMEIKICPSFWDITDEGDRASTLLHEASHVLFNLSDRKTGRNSAYMFEELSLNFEYLAAKNKQPTCP